VGEVALRRTAGRVSSFVGIGHGEIFHFTKRGFGTPAHPPVRPLRKLARIFAACRQNPVQPQNKLPASAFQGLG
jgi:hypothetical protein